MFMRCPEWRGGAGRTGEQRAEDMKGHCEHGKERELPGWSKKEEEKERLYTVAQVNNDENLK